MGSGKLCCSGKLCLSSHLLSVAEHPPLAYSTASDSKGLSPRFDALMIRLTSFHRARSGIPANGPLQRPRRFCCSRTALVSCACVSSPIAKYASCSRAHRSQKGTPRILTAAERGQGRSVSLRTWHGPSSLSAAVEKFPLRRGHTRSRCTPVNLFFSLAFISATMLPLIGKRRVRI